MADDLQILYSPHPESYLKAALVNTKYPFLPQTSYLNTYVSDLTFCLSILFYLIHFLLCCPILCGGLSYTLSWLSIELCSLSEKQRINYLTSKKFTQHHEMTQGIDARWYHVTSCKISEILMQHLIHTPDRVYDFVSLNNNFHRLSPGTLKP